MNGLILAAGLGTRLRPLTEHMPKALVPICGMPLLGRALSAMRDSGIDRIGVNCHYMAAEIERFRESSTVRFELFHEKDRIRGTGGAFFFAKKFLDESEAFVVCNVDILSSVDLRALGEQFRNLDCDCALVVVPVVSGGTIRFNKATLAYLGTAEDLPAPGPNAEPAEFIGIAFYRRVFLRYLTQDDFSIVPVWKRAGEQGASVRVISTPGVYWRDVGTAASYAAVHFDVLDGTLGLWVPRRMVLDRRGRRAYPSGLDEAKVARLGEHTWCELESVPRDKTFRRAVVLRNAAIGPGQQIENAIVTPWGTIGL